MESDAKKLLPKVIVSLTTYPRRFGCVLQVLEPILRQTVAPDEIQLWLSEEEFFPLESSVEDKLDVLTKHGVEVKWCSGNLRSHKKYYWAMLGNPEDVIITIDDDLIYPLTLVQTLLEAHYRWPKAIIASRTHMVKVDKEGAIAPYVDWMFEQDASLYEERRDLLATSGAGTLFPPNVFDSAALDAEVIERFAPLADDIWLMVQAARHEVSVVNTSANAHLSYIPDTQDEGLYIENLNGGGNDLTLQNLFDLYPDVEASLKACARENEVSSQLSLDNSPRRWGLLVKRLKKGLGR